MWAVYRHGVLTELTRTGTGEHWNKRWAGLSTVQALARWGYLEVFVQPRYQVRTSQGLMQSPKVWRAVLTRSGQEWIAREMAPV
jgi:hypothetical protein